MLISWQRKKGRSGLPRTQKNREHSHHQPRSRISRHSRSHYQGVTIGPDGIPICKAGLKMKTNGNDLRRQFAKFRCPLNNNGTCTCQSPCSSAKYGRTCAIPMETNIRLYSPAPAIESASGLFPLWSVDMCQR